MLHVSPGVVSTADFVCSGGEVGRRPGEGEHRTRWRAVPHPPFGTMVFGTKCAARYCPLSPDENHDLQSVRAIGGEG